MARKLKEVTFDEAIKRAREGEVVFAFDLTQKNKITVKQFNRLEIGEVVGKERAFYIVEEVQDGNDKKGQD